MGVYRLGFFDSRVICVLCDKEVGLNRNKTIHGWICRSCMNKLGNNKVYLWEIKKYSVEELKSISEKIVNNEKNAETKSGKNVESYSQNKAHTSYLGTNQPKIFQPTVKKLACPRCNGNNIDLISNDKNKKIVQKTSININPLNPLTVFNTKTVEKKKKSKGKIALGMMTGGASLLATGVSNDKNSEYFCRECGHKWIGK